MHTWRRIRVRPYAGVRPYGAALRKSQVARDIILRNRKRECHHASREWPSAATTRLQLLQPSSAVEIFHCIDACSARVLLRVAFGPFAVLAPAAGGRGRLI